MVAELVFLSPYLPHRSMADAGCSFSWAWLSALSTCGRVHLVTPASIENAAAPRDLPPSVEVTMVPLGPSPHPWAARFHDARTGGITPGIASLEAFRASPAFADAVASADLVEIHWQHLLPLASDVRSIEGRIADHSIRPRRHDPEGAARSQIGSPFQHPGRVSGASPSSPATRTSAVGRSRSDLHVHPKER